MVTFGLFGQLSEVQYKTYCTVLFWYDKGRCTPFGVITLFQSAYTTEGFNFLACSFFA